MAFLARLPLGSRLIDFLGHMRPDRRLECTTSGITFASPVGLGARLDPDAIAIDALARFGFGFLEVGPITVEPKNFYSPVERLTKDEAIQFQSRASNQGLDRVASRLERAVEKQAPILARLSVDGATSPAQATQACEAMLARLAPRVQMFSVDTLSIAIAEGWGDDAWHRHCRQLLAALSHDRPQNTPLLICLCADTDFSKALPYVRTAMEAGFAGVQVLGELSESSSETLIGKPVQARVLSLVRQLSQELGAECSIIASGGVHEPFDAMKLLNAGAKLVQVDSGLVFSGPGLAKRINDAVLFSTCGGTISSKPSPLRPAETDWFWALLMGIGMLFGGFLALAIASTRVVLPYDEDFVCMSREQFDLLNNRLLSFMSHDRVSLAGTMLAIGILYLCLAGFGMRASLHWARVAVLASAFAGFGSFFLFLGFNYFDPFHAFVTAILFQFLLLALHARSEAVAPPPWPNLHNDWQWKRSQWGQLRLIVHSLALVVAGMVISSIGATSVFVPEDLQFMQTSAELLSAANPKLIPLLAHDRASFGGMILSSGIATLLAALWGFRRGYRWLWWMFALCGIVAYLPAIIVHYAVGYVNLLHLMPAFSGLAVLAMGLALSYPYLCFSPRQAAEEWQALQFNPLNPTATRVE